MNPKSKILIILFVFISTIAFSQDYKKEIETQFLEYNKLIINKEFEKSMSFLPSEFFDIFPKEQMVIMMEKTFGDPEVEYEMFAPKNIEIAESEKIGDKYYSLLNYSSLMYMRFKDSDHEKETEEKHAKRMKMIKGAFELTFGAENVKYNEKTDFFEINSQKQAYAISNLEQTEWKFLVIEKKQKVILDKLLPKQLADKI